MKSVTLVKLVQLGAGTKRGTQCSDLDNYINGMIGVEKQHWHYEKCHWGWG